MTASYVGKTRAVTQLFNGFTDALEDRDLTKPQHFQRLHLASSQALGGGRGVPTGGPASSPANQPFLAPARSGARAAAGERLERGAVLARACGL